MWQKLLLLGAAGAAGTLARYGLAGVAQRLSDSEFPWGTLAVNVLGCFVTGAFWALAEDRLSISSQTRAVILIGFMGAFTTFSAYVLETGGLLRDAEWTWALGNVVLNNVLGVALFVAGLAAGRLL